MGNKCVELMSPAGDFAALSAALRSGADAIYFGVGELNMRARAAGNFTPEDLPKITAYCNAAHAKAYLTLNTILFDTELSDAENILSLAKTAGVNAVIAADPAVIAMANRIGIPVHLSVQANVCNIETVRFWAPYCDVMVLARELSLARIGDIIDAIKTEEIRGPSGELIRVEVFAHGALCVAFSGRCNMSLGLRGTSTSANRGRCVQPCRRSYRVTDTETGEELVIEGSNVMSPRDLCTVNRLDELLDCGVSVLKLEGRGRSPDYVATVTHVYREAIDAWKRGEFREIREKADWMTRLQQVFNRGFWEGGYYLDNELDIWADVGGSAASEQKTFIGKITAYYARLGVAECLIRAGSLAVDDEVWIIGPTTGAIRCRIGELRVGDDGHSVAAAEVDDTAAFAVPCKVRNGDAVYRISERRLT